MSVSANQLRPGNVINHEGFLWQCIESVHKTPGNLRAFVQAKMRNLINGTNKEFRFSSTEMLDKVDLRERPAQYLYADGDNFHFMDNANYEQFFLTRELLGDSVGYLLPETVVQITFFEEKALGVKLPRTMSFNIIDAEPNMKSSTATSSYKNATIETGVIVKVPQFIEVGNRITIDTENGNYLERAKDK